MEQPMGQEIQAEPEKGITMRTDGTGRREQEEDEREVKTMKLETPEPEEHPTNLFHSSTAPKSSHKETNQCHLANSSPSPTTPSIKQENHPESIIHHQPNPSSFSLWDHLKYQLNPELDYLQLSPNPNTLKSQRVYNFLRVPISVEKFIGFGFLICLDSFLAVFTILPIKFFLASLLLVPTLKDRLLHPTRTFFFLGKNKAKQKGDPGSKYQPKRLSVSAKIDLIQGLLIILVCVFLHHVTDASRMYHSVRGQETIKLYVIFNVLEVADRLCCSFGQDILDSLFSPSTLGRRIDGTQPHMKPIFLFTLAFIFTVAHTLVLFYQLVSLNVAINSFDDSLMTLLISNQFVEIKGSVFKKFEKENLFQMGCADIVERFQLFLMLTIIAVRNLIELSGSSNSTGAGSQQTSYTHQYLPTAFNLTPSLSLVEKTFSPVVVVMFCEILVDWLKHAFITKFNHIRPSIYGRFIDLLCKDLVGVDQVDPPGNSDQEMKPFVDRSPVVARRLGFSVFPMFCLTVRVSFQAINMLSDTSEEDLTTTDIMKNMNYSDSSINPAESSFFGFIKQQLHLIHSTLVGNQKDHLINRNPHLNPSSNSKSSSLLENQILGREWSSKFSNFQINSFIILSVIIVMIFLILIKLYLGIQIRSFAMRRCESLNERIAEDELNGKDRIPIGVTSSEMKRDQVDRKLLEQAEFELPQREDHQVLHPYSSTSCSPNQKAYQRQPPSPSDLPNSNCQDDSTITDQIPPTHLLTASANSPFHSSTLPLAPNSSSKIVDKKRILSMDELSRFDMVRSRIW